jgi:hypothetical protein
MKQTNQKRDKQEKIKKYLETSVSYIFERLMVEILRAQPDNVVALFYY